MITNTDDLYREELLEHYKNPHNFGKLKNADSYSHQTNPLCGDDIAIFLRLRSGQGFNGETIEDIKFIGKGCAICLAGASLLTDFARGKTKKELTNFTEKDMLDLLAIELSETRKKCGFLALAVLKDCINAKSKS